MATEHSLAVLRGDSATTACAVFQTLNSYPITYSFRSSDRHWSVVARLLQSRATRLRARLAAMSDDRLRFVHLFPQFERDCVSKKSPASI